MSGHDSPSARGEQIVSQLHLKALHAVLSARIPSISRATYPSPIPAPHNHRWFNLSLGDLPPPLDQYHHHHHIMDATVIDIFLCPCDPSPSSTPTARSSDSIIERWSVQVDPPAPAAAAPLSPARIPADGGAVALLNRRTYKRAVILLRSLYSVLRLLPAYLVFRKLSSSSQEFNYDISYRFASFAEPFTREKESLFRVYQFTPIETLFGQLTVSVAYRPDLSEFNFEVSSLQAPMIIANYVDSPVAEPMRPFPSSPASLPLKAARLPTSNPPLFSRPHSWSTSHVQGPERACLHKKGSLGPEVYRHSSPFSLSPSPSPPTLVSETAPVSIPVPVAGKGLLNRIQNYSDPTRMLNLPPPSPTRNVRLDQPSSQESPSESRSFKKWEGLRLADLYSNLQSLKLRDNRDDSGRFSGVLSSCDSPRIGFSRSSSRMSMQDDDDSEFSCPFAVDDVDTSDSQTRYLKGKDVVESSQGSVTSRRSQDAAVGILVNMLKTAPPLCRDRSFSSQSSKSEPTADASSSSSLSLSRKASDAMDELRSYREMKDMLLSQSGDRLSESVNRTTK